MAFRPLSCPEMITLGQGYAFSQPFIKSALARLERRPASERQACASKLAKSGQRVHDAGPNRLGEPLGMGGRLALLASVPVATL